MVIHVTMILMQDALFIDNSVTVNCQTAHVTGTVSSRIYKRPRGIIMQSLYSGRSSIQFGQSIYNAYIICKSPSNLCRCIGSIVG